MNQMNTLSMGTGPLSDGMAKPATPQDILDRFVGHDLKDEIEVSRKYLGYAEVLYDAGEKDLAMDVFDMAYEEFTHARFQKHVLKKMNREIPEELMLQYHQLKDCFRGILGD